MRNSCTLAGIILLAACSSPESTDGANLADDVGDEVTSAIGEFVRQDFSCGSRVAANLLGSEVGRLYLPGSLLSQRPIEATEAPAAESDPRGQELNAALGALSAQIERGRAECNALPPQSESPEDECKTEWGGGWDTPRQNYFRANLTPLLERRSEIQGQLDALSSELRSAAESERYLRVNQARKALEAELEYSLAQVVELGQVHANGIACKAHLVASAPGYDDVSMRLKYELERSTDGAVAVSNISQ